MPAPITTGLEERACTGECFPGDKRGSRAQQATMRSAAPAPGAGRCLRLVVVVGRRRCPQSVQLGLGSAAAVAVVGLGGGHRLEAVEQAEW